MSKHLPVRLLIHETGKDGAEILTAHLLVERRELERALKDVGNGPVTLKVSGMQDTMRVQVEIFDERRTPFTKTNYSATVAKANESGLQILHVSTQ